MKPDLKSIKYKKNEKRSPTKSATNSKYKQGALVTGQDQGKCPH